MGTVMLMGEILKILLCFVVTRHDHESLQAHPCPSPFLRTHPIPKRPPPDRASASQGHAPTMPGMHAEVSTPAPYCLLTGSEVVHIRARAAHAGGMACDEILSGKRPRHFWGTKHPHEYGIEKRAMR